jgi:hypothetical protein
VTGIAQSKWISFSFCWYCCCVSIDVAAVVEEVVVLVVVGIEVVVADVVVVVVVVGIVAVVVGIVDIWNCTCTVSRRFEKTVEAAVKEVVWVMVPMMKINEEEEEVAVWLWYG